MKIKSDTRIKAVLWDMDGTLFNTKKGIELAVKETLEKVGLPQVDSDRVEDFIGPPIQFGFRDVCGLSMDKAIETADIFREIYRGKGYVEECEPYEGLYKTLELLKSDGYLLGVCTLKKQDMAERIITKFKMDDIFDSIIGTDARDSIKKDDTIRYSCERYGIKTSEAVLIGDTDFDSIGAEKAGCLFIGVTYGFGFKAEKDVDAYPNIGTAHKPSDVYDLISGF